MIGHVRRGKRKISPSQKRCEKSCCVSMHPHMQFCADSGAPILKTPNRLSGPKCTRICTCNPRKIKVDDQHSGTAKGASGKGPRQIKSNSKVRRGKGSRLERGSGLWYSLTDRDSHEPGPPLQPGPPAPCPFPKRCRAGGPGSNGGRGPGFWCSSACLGSRSVGILRSGSPQRAGTPRIIPKSRQKVSRQFSCK